MDKELIVPGHLEIATEAATRLQSGEWSTNEVLIAALADLESFVRTPPGDQPFIDAGPLEPFPITKMVVNSFEELSNATSGQVSYGFAAVQQIGFIVAAVKGLEAMVQGLGRRVAQLEEQR
ncbi:hypothetical protein H7J71_25020 [Mycolicibacterium peregrinum]|uniref:hypothetical protein n=1 Tax=Mycolicibacterium peregrinum TaxID=43304 RepID=UPI0006D86284|nr:hypothetical protein [Mycolicibacterium peregrinum]MCV7205272.1 hypothetical protein [Mycolicibacterium peregrinum]ORW54827.1 hypothetical protein AWC21_24115 [Mycolicibacterium peregrinum]